MALSALRPYRRHSDRIRGGPAASEWRITRPVRPNLTIGDSSTWTRKPSAVRGSTNGPSPNRATFSLI
jgi:hypothetical protein